MRVRYTGQHPADLPTLGLHVEPGQVVEVSEGFLHPAFEPVPAEPAPTEPGSRRASPAEPQKDGDT